MLVLISVLTYSVEECKAWLLYKMTDILQHAMGCLLPRFVAVLWEDSEGSHVLYIVSRLIFAIYCE